MPALVPPGGRAAEIQLGRGAISFAYTPIAKPRATDHPVPRQPAPDGRRRRPAGRQRGQTQITQRETMTQPTNDANAARWGSDPIAETIRALGYRHVALVPGSSFRGLHDSIVNHLGNRDPQLVMTLHEVQAVLIAAGYARATDEPMAVALHSNVGLMQGTMGIFEAWCDRRPMLVIGATGPLDAVERRPWIDWIHTARDQAAMIRNYVKWDDLPGSAAAAVESVLRANQIARTEPRGPVYVCLDAGMQEARLDHRVQVPPIVRYAAPAAPAAPAAIVAEALRLLRAARRPLLLVGRGGRSDGVFAARQRLAERLGALVLSTTHNATNFPTTHPQHLLAPVGERPDPAEVRAVGDADVILSLDWHDLAGFLTARADGYQTQTPVAATVIHCSLDALVANGWSMDHQALPAVDLPVLAGPDVFVGQLLDALGDDRMPQRLPDVAHWTQAAQAKRASLRSENLRVFDLSFIVADHFAGQPVTYARLPFGWAALASAFDHPLAFLGKDAGGTVGSGPGHTVGTALALKDSGRMTVGIIGDGDFAMGSQALWTASHMDLPMLMIVANNQSYFNDEVHQERVARQRDRPVENKWIGQRIAPAVDNCAVARGMGFQAIGPVRSAAEVRAALAQASDIVAGGGRVVIDVQVVGGYGE